LYLILNQTHGEIFRIFDRANLKIIRVKVFCFFFGPHAQMCLYTLKFNK
jgi:hypothetical protein